MMRAPMRSLLVVLGVGLGLVLWLLVNLSRGSAPVSLAAPTATTWYVSPAGDDNNDCQTPATACKTVNAAVGKASDGDTIQIAAGTYVESSTINLGAYLTLQGAGAGQTILDGGGSQRVFSVASGAIVTMTALTIRNGKDNYGGGGISNDGTLILEDAEVVSNTASYGGGIYNNGVLTLTRTTVASNQSDQGGGIYHESGARLVIRESTIRDNAATNGGSGGGLFVNGGTATVERSTISGNQADDQSGAFHVQGSATVTLTNTTVSGNQTLGSLANAIYIVSGSTVKLFNSTVANNSQPGAAFENTYGTLIVQNSILANASNCSSGATSLGNNLADDTSCNLTQSTDQESTDPKLGPLADNGGPTLTHALLSGSPAIDAGNNAACPATDQRGYSRPYDGNNDGTATCDIGAFEFRHQLAIADTTVTEGDSGTVSAVFTVTLSPTRTQAVTVTYATADGTATAGQDYTAASGTLVFNPGEASKSITVAVLGDTTDEPNETFTVTLSNAQGADIVDAQGVGTIVDDDGLPSLTINDATVTEGDSGTVNAVFTVTLSPASGSLVTVDYATADGTATAGQDYTATSGTLVFNPGETSKTITVTVQGDQVDEGSAETFTVTLSNAQNATIYDGQGVGTITDDDTATLSVNDPAPVTEGDSGTRPVSFEVTLSTPSAFTVTVDYATSDNTATAGEDYITATGTLTFTPGMTRTTVTVQIIGDTVDEPDEAFYLYLSNAQNAGIQDNSGTAYITDDDGLPTLSLYPPLSQNEGDSGTYTVAFNVLLSPASGQVVTVDYTVTDGTAKAGEDYTVASSSGTLTFNPGETSRSITITVIGDLDVEPDETLTVTLSNPVNANLDAAPSASFTILNDDGAVPKLVIGDATVTEGDSGTVNAVFTVTLGPASSQVVTVDYTTADGTAKAGQDYTATSGTLTFNAGETQKTITVPVLGDTASEGDETFTVTLSNPTNANVADAYGVGTIRDDDFVVYLPLVLR